MLMFHGLWQSQQNQDTEKYKQKASLKSDKTEIKIHAINRTLNN